jgi:hypothetical protein
LHPFEFEGGGVEQPDESGDGEGDDSDEEEDE